MAIRIFWTHQVKTRTSSYLWKNLWQECMRTSHKNVPGPTQGAAWFRRFSQKKTAVFGCLTNALAPLPIALESCSAAQTDRPV